MQENHYLITGASSGIGQTTAVELSKRCKKLSLCGRNQERLQQTIDLCEPNCEIDQLLLDLTDLEKLEDLCAKIDALDGVVHSAGTVFPVPIKFLKQEKIQAIMDINFLVPVQLSSLLLKKKKIRKGASMVFVSSIAAQHPYKGGAIYASSKAALEAFAKAFAIETASAKIRSNCVAPAMVATPMMDATREWVDTNKMDDHSSAYPLGLGSPLDVANAILFLLSDDASWVTGQVLRLDGGLMTGA